MVQTEWGVGEAYVGRWSRRVAGEFLRWLDAPAGGRWLDVGCGTGALTAAVLATADPAEIVGVDPAEGFLADARTGVVDERVRFELGDARALPVPDRHFDVVVSALALNFVPEPERAVGEFSRVTRPNATVAAYLWDYAEGMAMMRYFWDAASALDPIAAGLEEGLRFPLCRPEPLRELWTGAGFTDVAVRAIEIPTRFVDFDDYWQPFLGGQGPAPGYVATLNTAQRDELREVLRSRLPVEPDGGIPLTARAWAVRGRA